MVQVTAFLGEPSLKSFSQHLLERGQLHHLLSQQLFQFGILNLKCFQSLGLRHFHAARFGPPLIKRRIAHALIAAQLLRAKPCL